MIHEHQVLVVLILEWVCHLVFPLTVAKTVSKEKYYYESSRLSGCNFNNCKCCSSRQPIAVLGAGSVISRQPRSPTRTGIFYTIGDSGAPQALGAQRSTDPPLGRIRW